MREEESGEKERESLGAWGQKEGSGMCLTTGGVSGWRQRPGKATS